MTPAQNDGVLHRGRHLPLESPPTVHERGNSAEASGKASFLPLLRARAQDNGVDGGRSAGHMMVSAGDEGHAHDRSTGMAARQLGERDLTDIRRAGGNT